MKRSLRAKRMERHHSRHKTSKLNLVSLMDIFTILVFFLMVNTGDVEVLQADKTIQLPESVAEKKPAVNLLIKVNDKSVIVQGRDIASVESVMSQQEDVIDALETELKFLASRRPEMTEREKRNGRAVTIMGDQKLPSKLLKRVMVTCAQADYRDIALAVAKVGGEGEDAASSSRES